MLLDSPDQRACTPGAAASEVLAKMVGVAVSDYRCSAGLRRLLAGRAWPGAGGAARWGAQADRETTPVAGRVGPGAGEEMRQVIWMIEAAEKEQPWITEEYRLPESFDIDTAAAWVGDHPDLVGSVFDIPPVRILEMEQLLGITADADRVEYFLVARAD